METYYITMLLEIQVTYVIYYKNSSNLSNIKMKPFQ